MKTLQEDLIALRDRIPDDHGRDVIAVAVNTIDRLAALLPRKDDWDGGAGRLEDLADILDQNHAHRPDHSHYVPH